MLEQYYSGLVEFLGSVLGPNYEIVLYAGPSLLATAVAHGYISGARVGLPMPPAAIEIKNRESMLRNICKYTYDISPQSGNTIACYMLFIRDGHSELAGVLAISVNVTKYQHLCEELLHLTNMKCLSTVLNTPKSSPVHHGDIISGKVSVDDVARAALKEYLGDDLSNGEKLSPDDKMAIVRNLSDKGVFNVKGAISVVAQIIKCSEASVYRYLSKSKGVALKSAESNIIVSPKPSNMIGGLWGYFNINSVCMGSARNRPMRRETRRSDRFYRL